MGQNVSYKRDYHSVLLSCCSTMQTPLFLSWDKKEPGTPPAFNEQRGGRWMLTTDRGWDTLRGPGQANRAWCCHRMNVLGVLRLRKGWGREQAETLRMQSKLSSSEGGCSKRSQANERSSRTSEFTGVSGWPTLNDDIKVIWINIFGNSSPRSRMYRYIFLLYLPISYFLIWTTSNSFQLNKVRHVGVINCIIIFSIECLPGVKWHITCFGFIFYLKVSQINNTCMHTKMHITLCL